jgi:hypothetical protein
VTARFAAVALVAALLTAPASAQYDAIDEALSRHAPKVIDALKKKNWPNTGVLKFLVRKGSSAPRDDAGELNMALATRLEVALILGNNDEKFGILKTPSATVMAEGNTLANHLDPDGRKAFFRHKYDLAWSNDKIDAGGFVTGLVTLSDDLKDMSVQLKAFDKSGTLEDLPLEIKLPTNPRVLAEAGYSYTISKEKQTALVSREAPKTFAEQEKLVTADVVKVALKETPARTAAPPKEPFAPLTDSPVKLTVQYNGATVPVHGNTVAEPKESDKVSFVLENKGDATYAVVLLLNGENTLYRGRGATWAARKWVLPAGTSVTITGFQTDDKTSEPFKVLSPEESDGESVNYGEHAGTFRMVVYRGDLTEKDPEINRKKEYTEDDLALVAIARGAKIGGTKPQSLKALQAELRGREKAGEGARGLIVKGGNAETSEVQKVYFKPTPEIAVADVTLRYYTPKKK